MQDSTSRILAGRCRVMFAYDIALAADLNAAHRLLSAAFERSGQREPTALARNAPSCFEYQPPPLRFTLEADAVQIAGFQVRPLVEVAVFDFGAVSLCYEIPIDGPLERLPALSQALSNNRPLLDCSRTLADQLAQRLAPALTKPGAARTVEDLAVFCIERLEQATQSIAFVNTHARVLASILRAESDELSQQQVTDATSVCLSYRPDDAAIIDWNACILLDNDPTDVLGVLEYANVELMEMRFLDDRLDRILEQSSSALQARTIRRWFPFGLGSRELRRVAELQMESAMLFEGVNNALKLVGDQYLARIYRAAAQRFHLPEHDASIERKLATLESIYQKVKDHQATGRMETLEWIVILLIAFEVVMSLVRH